jgi:DNA-binding transcriptional LysR family regulator
MDLRQLKTLLAVAERGSFGKAAEAVHLTPSAVSQQMNALETELGVLLFDRSSRRPVLNAHGLQMLEAAQRLVQIADEAVDAISGRRAMGTLNVGCVRTSAFSLLPRAIVAMKARHPHLRIKLRVGSTEPFLADVVARRLDAAIVAEHVAMPRDLRWSPFIREPLLVIAPPGTAWRPGEDLLRDLPFIRFRSAVPLANLIDTELARHGVPLTEIAEIDSIAAIVTCVKFGLGTSVVPDIAVRDPGLEGLVVAPFGDPQVHRQMGLVERHKNPSAHLVEDLHETLAVMSGAYGVRRTYAKADAAKRLRRMQAPSSG